MKEVSNILTNGTGWSTDEYLVIHSTDNPGATAANHLSYWRTLLSKGDYSMARYVLDWEGTVYQIAPDHSLLWEVGYGNSRVFGIELCEATTAEQFICVWNAAVEWAAKTLKAKGMGIDRLISHDDARRIWGGTSHTDPIPYFTRFGKTWAQFVEAVKSQLTGTPKQQPGEKVNDNGLLYRAHVGGLGWLDWVGDGQWAGTRGFSTRLEAIEVDTSGVTGALVLGCAPHVANLGWLPSKEMGKGIIVGTTGESRRAEALAFYVIENTTGMTPYFQVHAAYTGDSAVKVITNDIPLAVVNMLGTTGQSRQLEALRIWLAA